MKMKVIKFNKSEGKNNFNKKLNEAIKKAVDNINTKALKQGEKVILIKDDTKEN